MSPSDLPNIDQLWDYNNPIESEQKFREVLQTPEVRQQPAYATELLTQISRAVCLQRKFKKAHEILDEVENQLTPEMKRSRLRMLLERGRLLNDTGFTQRSIESFQTAWELAQEIDDRQLGADVLHMIAYVTSGEESLHWYRVAINFCKENSGKRFRQWQCTLFMNAADKLEERQQINEAKTYVEQSLAIAKELHWEERIALAKCFLARLARLSGDIPAAMRLIEEILQSDNPRGYFYEELAECLLSEGRIEDSRPHFRHAFDLLSQDPWFPPTESARLERLRNLGYVDFK